MTSVKLRVWWIPQVPMEPFEHPVPTIEAGKMLCEALAYYDLFQLKHNIKPDYCNVGGMSWKHPKVTGGEWWDFDPDEEDEVEEVRAALAQGIEARRGETEGLDAQRESPVPKGNAPPSPCSGYGTREVESEE